MKRFVDGVDRRQSTLFPECLEDWISEDNPASSQLPRHGRQLRVQHHGAPSIAMAAVCRLCILVSANGAPSSVARNEQHEPEGAE
jgi:hypothetical protein